MSAISSFATRDLTVSGLTSGLSANVATLVDRVLERLAPEPVEATAEAAADSQWMPRLVTGFIEAVPYTRGAIAMSVDAARGLLDLQARDPRSARRVLEHLGTLARSAANGARGALSIVDETLVVVQESNVGAALVVTHIA